MKIAWVIVGVIVVVVVLAFLFQNSLTVPVTLLTWEFETQVGLIMAAAFVAGFILAILLFLPGFLTKSYNLSKLKKKNEKLEDKVENEGIIFESKGLGSEGEKFIK